tara:strand:+ start:1671 stop:2126 length:456 start_codon:yes stop_codon:yes gene_type:complete
MFDNIKNNTPPIIIALGFLVYICLIVSTSLAAASIWALFTIYLWLISSLYLKQYNFNTFLYILCFSGIILSVSFFFLQGVEELPYPEGALMFHVEGIAKAAFLFFICTVPVILLKTKNTEPNKNFSQQKENIEMWEKASEKDLQSGNYEPL